MRICSLLPSATEILHALGVADQLVSVPHPCTLDTSDRPSAEIDAAIRAALARGEPLYRLDEEALRRAQPDLLITQDLCEVCAISTSDVRRVVRTLPHRPHVLSLHAHTLQGVLHDIRTLGDAIGRPAAAEALITRCRERLAQVRAAVEGAPRPSVCCLEWIEPPMATGHWVPEMVECAGGREVLGRAGQRSRYIAWDEVVAASPEVLVVIPCGVSPERARHEVAPLATTRWWNELPAVQAGRVYFLDGSAHFNRPGPGLIHGVELLAARLHPMRYNAPVLEVSHRRTLDP